MPNAPWYLSVCVKMPNIDHKVRVVILWKYKNDAEPRKILVTNKIHWNAERIIETYPDKKYAKAIRDVIHNRGRTKGWENVGFIYRSAEYIAKSVSRWWGKIGRARFPKAKRILITVDTDVVSNGDDLEKWKSALKEQTRSMGLEITVCHFPPGTSKWSKIEIRLFSLFPKVRLWQPLYNRYISYDFVTKANFISHPTSNNEQPAIPDIVAFVF